MAAKSRVAPIRQLSIPKLELQGALVGYRLSLSVLEELRFKIDRVCYWTDSKTVLQWLHSENYRFQSFVANRTSEILEKSQPNQWRHVPGMLNPADDCSRGLQPSELNSGHRWFHGPEFLHLEELNWPGTFIPDPEYSAEEYVGNVNLPQPDVVEQLFNRCSSLYQLKRIFGWMLRFKYNCQKQHLRGNLTVSQIEESFQILLRIAQSTQFPSEIHFLASGKPLLRTSSILKLTPFLDQSGLLRVGGRLKQAEMSPGRKHPVLLASRHALTKLIIRHYHLMLGHAPPERTLHEIRSRFWILRGRSAIRQYVDHCVSCRRRNVNPKPPLMADLPRHRLQPFLPPFSNVGIDYFGPYEVVIFRRHVKRYCCLFTCLVTRAVHLELTQQLDADSFLMAVRRFISRRGRPKVIYSDNGTNLRAGDREIREGLERMQKQKIADTLTQQEIEWHFSPPSAPHFGGIWERIVRSCKEALKFTLNARATSDEVLTTVFAEVESLLNGRPLTHLSVDPNDSEPLTPNHFLLGRPNPNLPPDVIVESDISSRRRWKTAGHY